MSLCDWPNMMMSSCDSCCGASIHAPLAADVLSWLVSAFESDSLAEPGEALTCGTKDMTAVNAAQHGLHELVTAVGGGGSSSTGGGASLRLPLMQPSGHHTHAHAVFMYSTAADGNVTLQLRDACTGGDDCTGATTGVGGSSASGVSAAAGADGVTTLSISYQDIATDLLGDAAASIDVLLGTAPPTPTMCTATLHAATGGDDSGGPGGGSINETSATTVLDLFDSSSGGHDLTLSPQTFTSSAEAFINDNSDSLGVPQDSVDTVCTTEELKKSVSVTTSDVTKLTVKRARPKAASPNRQGPQQCQVCSKVFGNASALAKHKLTHSDERKYVCSMCGKAFKRQDHLNGHMLTHRNKKPYECKADGCGKSYCDARSLRRHTENHHSGGAAVGGVGNNGAGAVAALAGTGGSGSGGGALVGAAAVVSTSTLSPAQGAASGDAASPHGSASSTCIQYAPPPTNGSTDLKNGSENGLTGTKTGSSTGKSQLQQLLASEPASKNGSNTPNNDGLTKQQLDLIHQIMEQTQRQSQQISAAAANNGASNKTSGSSARASSTAKPKLSRTWSAPVQTSGGTSKSGVGSNGSSASSTSGGHGRSSVSGSGVGGASSGAQGSGSAAVVVTPKPVECNLCHRKFKNIPALNGHMRLHGGYFKKDAENKKCEKKESTGPPLQTASVSVRALIEEKIISKRTTNPQNITVTSSTASAPTTPTADSTRTNAPPLYPLTSGSDTSKVTSFVVPAPPNHTVTASTEKIRRHSDTEKFTIPRTPNSSVSSVAVTAQQEAEALADLILKRGAKVVKRTTSDPGGQTQQQLQIQFQQASDAFALAGVTYQSDDGSGYFSPSLQDDVFHQVQDTMLLQGVDATQLAESIQLQAASLLQDQSADQQLQDIASLEDYASVTASLQESVNSPSYGGPHTVNHELQAVLDSPLPESLAEFSAYHPSDATANSTSTADDSASPLQRFAASSASPRTGSPLVRHDSPGFAYPTPPASHEGQSPGGGYSGAHLLPMLSPQTVGDGQNNNAFARTTDLEEPPQASSPLSAAFYTSTMSSAAAVEEALEEVLPGETIAPDDMYPSLTNSPPPAPQSPLSVGMTPVPSPNVPASPTMVNSPAHVAFPLSSPHHYAALQSQMMPNSEDPLLSSSPKDFATRKRFEFNSGNIQSFRIISTSGNDASSGGLIELPPGSATAFSGILVDSNGELKFIQAAPGAFHNAKNIVVTSTGALSPLGPTTNGNSQAPTVVQIVEAAPSQLQQSVSSAHALRTVTVSPHHTHHQQNQILQPHRTHHLQRLGSRAVQCTVPGKPNVTPRPKLHIAVDNLKQEEADDVFLSPTMIPASPIRASRKRPRSEPTLTVPIVHQSRLRAAKGRPPGAAPYTPAPMLNPSRPGPGLYAHAKWKASSPSMSTSNCSRNTTSSTGRKFGNSNSNTNPERRNCSSPVDSSTPESDSTPHINVGCQYQCSYIPDAVLGRGSNTKDDREPNYEHLLWDPCITTTCTDAEVEMYLEFACCAAVPGGGRNKEYALHLLHMCSGNIHDAMLKLMQPTPSLPPDHPLLAYQYCESDKWSTQETEAFHRALLKHNKDFSSVSRDIGTKNVKQCVQFYYVWKKVCSDEYRRMRGTLTPSSRDTPPLRDTTDAFDMKLLGMVDAEPPLVQAPLTHTMDLPRTFTCEYADCSASFNSRAALNGHIRIHGGTVRRSPTPGPQQQQNSIGGVMGNSAISHQQHGGDIASRRQSQQHHHQTDEEFPCKVCGKVFTKIKSRSAHMKSHRPPDAEPKRAAKGDAPCSSPYDASMSPATPNAVHSPLLGSQ